MRLHKPVRQKRPDVTVPDQGTIPTAEREKFGDGVVISVVDEMRPEPSPEWKRAFNRLAEGKASAHRDKVSFRTTEDGYEALVAEIDRWSEEAFHEESVAAEAKRAAERKAMEDEAARREYEHRLKMKFQGR
jgi:hypothetical protein